MGVNKDLLENFRQVRRQCEDSVWGKENKKKENKKEVPKWDFANIDEEDVYKFSNKDILDFFKYLSIKHNTRTVFNIARDTSCIKKAKENYDNLDICLMIEFIFEGCDYLDKIGIRPTILHSAFTPQLYKDSKLWVDGKYRPRKKKLVKKREWEGETEDEIKVGW